MVKRDYPEELIESRQSLLSRMRIWSDDRSWQEFFETYWKLIYSVARRSGLSPQEAEDVVQETLRSVAKSIPDFKYDPARCRFKTWLQTLTRRRVTDQFRKRASAGIGNRMDETEAGAPSALELIWDEEFERQISEAALARAKEHFNPEQFQLFELYALQRMPLRTVADLFHVSAGRVYLAKHRVAKFLRGEIKRLLAGWKDGPA